MLHISLYLFEMTKCFVYLKRNKTACPLQWIQTNIVSLTLSWPIFVTEIGRFIWALSVSLCPLELPELQIIPCFRRRWVAGIAGLVARIIHTHFTYGYIFVRFFCSIFVDNFKSNVFLYVNRFGTSIFYFFLCAFLHSQSVTF